MNWKQILVSDPLAAEQIKKHLEECSCGACEKVDTFSFEQKDGIVKAVGANDAVQGMPPLWYIPGKYAKYPDDPNIGYVTGDLTEYELSLIKDAGFDFDPTKYAASPLDSLLDSLFSTKPKVKSLKH